MKIVVTGGAGFIGSNLVRRLVASPEITQVVALDDLSTGCRENLRGTGAELAEGSILDSDALDEVVAGASSVVHLAARPSVPRSMADPLASHQVNATGTLMVLEAARRAGGVHVITASSSSVYGANPELPKHELMRTAPISPYAVSKQAAEAYTLSHRRAFGLPTTAFRFFNVYGPHQSAGHAYAAVVPAFLDAALRGNDLPVHGDGEQSRDFTYVGTVVEVLADAARRRVETDLPVNLAFGTRTTLNGLIEQLAQILGQPLSVDRLPPRTGDVRDSQADNALLRTHFPNVEPVGLPAGLEATLAWFRTLPGYPDS